MRSAVEHSSWRCGALAVLALFAGCGQRHLPLGSQYAMAEALLRHELTSSHSHLGDRGSRCPCYVLVGGKDLPPKQVGALNATGERFSAGSAWTAGHGLRVQIGLPRRRWNGNFDVALRFECGPGCEESDARLMRYDGSRWRVLD